MSWVRSGSVRCKCVPYQDKHILGSGGDSQSVLTVFSGFLVASIPWRIVHQSVKVTDSFLSFLFNLILFRIVISKGRALNKLVCLIRLDFEFSHIFRSPTSGGVTSRTRSVCLSVCFYVCFRHLARTQNISVPSWWSWIKLSGLS